MNRGLLLLLVAPDADLVSEGVLNEAVEAHIAADGRLLLDDFAA